MYPPPRLWHARRVVLKYRLSLRNTPPRLPLREVDFHRKSLSPPVLESSNPETSKTHVDFIVMSQNVETHSPGGHLEVDVGSKSIENLHKI